MRCYNGCPDAELQAWLDSQEALRRELSEKRPGARATWFPNGEFWMVFGEDLRPVTGEHRTLAGAVREATQ